MNAPSGAGHLPADEITAYVRNELAEDGEERVEVHLATCDACAGFTAEVRFLEGGVRNWRTRGYGEALEQTNLLAAIEQAESEISERSLAERLTAWRAEWAGRAESAVGVVVEGTGVPIRLFVEGLEALVRPGGHRLELVPVGPIRARGPGSADRRPATEGTPSSARGAGPEETRIEVDAESGALEVRLVGWEPDRRPPLLLLREGKRCVEVRTPVEEGGALVARFTPRDPGVYVVQIEPEPRRSP